ncbi:hypothetical protein DRQ26_00345 [bacterium]|nr:MAG: hypothetical protein DRQ26_00345 [bacterium]
MKNFLEMFLGSSFLSQAIIALLIVMSAYCWAIIYIKWCRFKKINSQNKKIKGIIGSRKIVDMFNLTLSPADNPLVLLVEAIKKEAPLERITDSQGRTITRRILPDNEILRDRLDAEIELILSQEESRIDFLATTASVAPFLGLLGTVLGITQSFWEIGKQSTSNIAVVAPGLAEALITTIVGLIVAIPAALGYNWLRAKLRDLSSELEHFSRHILVRLSKETR